jgi:hypothetical protein
MKPICVPCQRFYRPKKNGFAFIEGMPIGNGVEPGLRQPESWEPYKLWRGDLWHCPDCGAEIIVGVAPSPMSEHYRPDFVEHVESSRATLQVNDC